MFRVKPHVPWDIQYSRHITIDYGAVRHQHYCFAYVMVEDVIYGLAYTVAELRTHLTEWEGSPSTARCKSPLDFIIISDCRFSQRRYDCVWRPVDKEPDTANVHYCSDHQLMGPGNSLSRLKTTT